MYLTLIGISLTKDRDVYVTKSINLSLLKSLPFMALKVD